MKVLLPNMLMTSQMQEMFLARFRREANIVARLEHVNIVPIYAYGEQDGLAYLVMPYLEEREPLRCLRTPWAAFAQ